MAPVLATGRGRRDTGPATGPEMGPGTASTGSTRTAGTRTAERTRSAPRTAGRVHPDAGSATGRPLLLSVGVAVVATAVAVGSIVQVVRIGESGSKAVWSGVVTGG